MQNENDNVSPTESTAEATGAVKQAPKPKPPSADRQHLEERIIHLCLNDRTSLDVASDQLELFSDHNRELIAAIKHTADLGTFPPKRTDCIDRYFETAIPHEKAAYCSLWNRAAMLSTEPNEFPSLMSDLQRQEVRKSKTEQINKAIRANKFFNPPTDLENADVFCMVNKDRLLYCSQWKSWLVWDGKRWERDDNRKARNIACDFVKSVLPTYAQLIVSEEHRQKFLRHAANSQSQSKIDAMLSLAATRMAVSSSELDSCSHLINLHNGTFNLKSLALQPHRSTDKLTKLARASYRAEPIAECHWTQFLERIFNGDKALIGYAIKSVGISIMPMPEIEKAFILYGGGRNGKTTFVNAIQYALGDYALSASPTLLLWKDAKFTNANSDDTADLFGTRFVSLSETPENMKLDEAKLKNLASNKNVRAMRKYERSIEFPVTWKIYLDTNYLPKIKGNDEGIWRRIVPIPFTVSIPESEMDLELGSKLQAEADTVFATLVQGLKAYRADGLLEPSAVVAAKAEYRNSSDLLGQFLSDSTTAAAGKRVSKNDLYSRYESWANDNGIIAKLTKMDFSKCMKDRGMVETKSNGIKYWKDIEAAAPANTADNESDGAF